jgi:hypothetical protein
MQPYINHLLEDITKAHRTEELIPAMLDSPKTQTIEDDFAEIERWLENDPIHTFSYYCGLEKELFPPAEQFSKKQLLSIIKAFKHLLFSWNLDASIPKNVPPAKTYSLLLSVLDRKTDIVNSGFMTFEFCNYDSSTCPFEEYCTCKDFEIDGDDNMNTDLQEGELPF